MTEHTLLLRQAHPSTLQNGELTSQAFFPFPKDKGELSVYDGDLISAEHAYQYYTITLGLNSVGVWAVSGEEVSSIELKYRSDPVEGSPAHAVIVFGTSVEKQCRKLAKRLKQFAIARGCLYSKK